MSFCTACGHARTRPGQFCTACGAALAPERDAATPLATVPAPPGPGGLGPSGGPPDVLAPPSRRRGRAGIIAAVTALIVLAGGGGAAAWLTLHHRHRHAGPPAIAQSSGPGRVDDASASPLPSPAPTPASPPVPSPAPASSPVPAPVASGGASILTVAPGVGQDPRAALVRNFLNSYFAAINGHDYQQYRALLGRKLRRDESAQAFTSGYSSTSDSAATLNSISSLGGGEVGAAVTCTSHQYPSQSPTDTGCTDWNIIVYLTIHGGRYLLGPAPAAYRAGYQSC